LSGTATAAPTAEKPGGDVTDYLASVNKRKRKSYIILAFGDKADPAIVAAVQAHIKTTYPQVMVATPRTPEEFRKQSSRDVMLIIVDDEAFGTQSATLDLVKSLKEKKFERMPPALFLSRNPPMLIELYNSRMMQFHETDDYLSTVNMQPQQLFYRMKTLQESVARRRSRRFRIDAQATMTFLNDSKGVPVEIIDMSVHGALIKIADKTIFKVNEQLRLNINIGFYVRSPDGEFLAVAGRIRRVLIGGNIAGVSFEYVSERQLRLLSEYLVKIVLPAPVVAPAKK
jgi:hypothetical protein